MVKMMLPPVAANASAIQFIDYLLIEGHSD